MRITAHAIALAIALAVFGGPGRAATAAEASAECVNCHDADDLPDMTLSPHAPRPKKPPMPAAAEAMRGSPMAEASDPRAPTCVDCHGFSPNHVKKPNDARERPRPDRVFSRKGGAPAAERNAACMTCHQKDSKRALWGGSQHEGADVACTACHKVHTNQDRALARTTQGEVCFSCHKEQRAQLQRPSHHPVPEGRMTCADCHNVHGSAGPKLARRDTTNDTCYGCHAEKRGPFVHQHEPVAEDCGNCHNPHGSSVNAMLKSRPPLLCQQCHTPHVAGGVGALGGQAGVYTPARPGGVPAVTATTGGKNVVNLWQGRSCLNCHTQIHGSNNPSATNPTPHLLLR